MFLASIVILSCFYFLERWKERHDRDPLFEFKHLRLRTYRYGLLTGLIVAMGQLGITFVLPVFLQDGRHLTAVQNGWWQLPTGIFVIIGAQLGGRLIRYLGTTVVVRIGFLAYGIGVVLIFRAVSVDITALELFPGLAFYGIGIGFALAQLTNVVLSEIPKESSGSRAAPTPPSGRSAPRSASRSSARSSPRRRSAVPRRNSTARSCRPARGPTRSPASTRSAPTTRRRRAPAAPSWTRSGPRWSTAS